MKMLIFKFEDVNFKITKEFYNNKIYKEEGCFEEGFLILLTI